jgi:Leucine-rich repeat (LRR) protein
MTNLTCLESLEIIHCPNLILPATMNKLTSLRQLRIYGEYENETLLNGLEGIPSLQHLSLSGFPSLVTLPDWLGTMTSLQTLQIEWCHKLSSLPDWLGTMTSLQTLAIMRCPKLTSLPASFKGLINLHELSIVRCPMLVKRCKKETGEDWHKISHVPKLKLEESEYVEPPIPSFYGNLINSFAC